MALIQIPAAAAVAAAYTAVTVAMMALHPVLVIARSAAVRTILFAVSFTPKAVHFRSLHSCINTIINFLAVII
jgi:predicted membrane protein